MNRSHIVTRKSHCGQKDTLWPESHIVTRESHCDQKVAL